MASKLVTVTLQMADGEKASTTFRVEAGAIDPDDAVVAGIVAAIDGISGGDVLRFVQGAEDADIIGTAEAGVYSASTDRAVLEFLDEDGLTHKITVPAPDAAIFLSGTEVVDLANANIVTLRDALMANCTGTNGAEFTSLVRGYRIKANSAYGS